MTAYTWKSKRNKSIKSCPNYSDFLIELGILRISLPEQAMPHKIRRLTEQPNKQMQLLISDGRQELR